MWWLPVNGTVKALALRGTGAASNSFLFSSVIHDHDSEIESVTMEKMFFDPNSISVNK